MKNDLEKKLEYLEIRMKDVKNSLSDFEKEKELYKADIEFLQGTLEGLNGLYNYVSLCYRLTTENEQLSNSVQVLLNSNTELDIKVSKYEKAFSQQIENDKEDKLKYKKEIQEIEDELETYKEMYDNKLSLQRNLELEISGLKIKLEIADEKNKEKDSIIRELSEEIHDLDIENSDLRSQIIDLEDEDEDYEDKIEELEKDIEDWEYKYSELEDKLERTSIEVKTLVDVSLIEKIHELQKELGSFKLLKILEKIEKI